MISPVHYLALSVFLFAIGLTIVTVRRHPLLILLGVALMFQAVNLSLVALTGWFQDWNGQVAALIAIAVAFVELAVGLGFLVARRQRAPDRHDDNSDILYHP